MTRDLVLSDEELGVIDARASQATMGPWQAFVEGRDHFGGDDMIRLGGLEDFPDMYVTHESTPAPASDLDFIANARQDIPRLVAEVRRLREMLADDSRSVV